MGQDTKTNAVDECTRAAQTENLPNDGEISDANLNGVAGGHMRGNITRRRPQDRFSTSKE